MNDPAYPKYAPLKLGGPWIFGVTAICVLPFLLGLVGVDFGNHARPFPWASSLAMAPHLRLDAMFYRLPGVFTHTILEWSAFCTAIFTVILSFVHYSVKRDVVVPIVGIALFCAGTMDAFHTLAAARLIEAVADNQNLIPFTWAICRLFNAMIMIVGLGFFMIRRRYAQAMGMSLIVTMSLTFSVVAYTIIHLCATTARLPQTMFPGALITRPYDVAPLVLFVVGGAAVYIPFYYRHRSVFTHALVVSLIPDIATQLYMVFGSVALFDHNFNVAHFLKIIAYVVPFIGLVLDYIRTYREEVIAVERLQTAQLVLAARTTELERSNRELEDFAYVASHDLQEPLRKIQTFGDRLLKKYSDQLEGPGRDYLERMHGASARMQALIGDLLTFSRVTLKAQPFVMVDLERIAHDVVHDLEMTVRAVNGSIGIGHLPTIEAEPFQMYQLLQNLLSNALKFHKPDVPPHVTISAHSVTEDTPLSYKSSPVESYQINIQDNGIGFDEQYLDRVFSVFQRLHGRNDYEGSGVGLAICRKIAERHHGHITAKSTPGQGTTFIVTLPVMQPREESDDV